MKTVWIAALCAAGMGYVSTLHAQANTQANMQANTQAVWKLATGYRAESFHTENIAQFGRDINAATGSKLKLELAPNGSLFKLNDIRQAVQDGKVEAGETIMTSMVKDIPIAGADSIPFVVGSYKWRSACGNCSALAWNASLRSVASRSCMPCHGRRKVCTPRGPSVRSTTSRT